MFGNIQKILIESKETINTQISDPINVERIIHGNDNYVIYQQITRHIKEVTETFISPAAGLIDVPINPQFPTKQPQFQNLTEYQNPSPVVIHFNVPTCSNDRKNCASIQDQIDWMKNTLCQNDKNIIFNDISMKPLESSDSVVLPKGMTDGKTHVQFQSSCECSDNDDDMTDRIPAIDSIKEIKTLTRSDY